MIKKLIWSLAFILAATLLQSKLLSNLTNYIHAVPDIALCILVYAAYVNGTMSGQLTGFFSGFLMDFLWAAPLGLNALVHTLVGAVAGFLKGTLYLDFFFLPMALCAGATILKAFIYFLLHLFFPEAVPTYLITGLTFWIELGLNTFLAPFLFAFLGLFQQLISGQRVRS